jgi:plastocyanin
MKTFAHALVAVVLVVVMAGTALATTHDIMIGDNFYSPTSLVVTLGDSIMWTNTGIRLHTVDQSTEDASCNSLPGGFTSGTLNPGDTFLWVADSLGDVFYHCAFHCPSMSASLTVMDAVGTESSAWSTLKSLYR